MRDGNKARSALVSWQAGLAGCLQQETDFGVCRLMPWLPLKFIPGIMKEGTRSSPDQSWYDCDKVRFRMGQPETIGGWEKYNKSTQMIGTTRDLFPWVAIDGTQQIAAGTHRKYYVIQGQFPYDVTPLRKTTDPLGSDPIATTSAGSAVLTVTDTSHGATDGAYVTISGATGPIDGIPASEINAEHEITAIVDANNYQITVTTTASAGSTSGGGSAVVAAYQINPGLDVVVSGTGWGSDSFGAGGWGEASTSLVVSDLLRLWSQDNFGEDLLMNIRNGGIYYWDYSSGTSTRAVEMSSLAGSQGAPTIARQIMVSDEDRHVICFACDPLTDPGNQDVLRVRWSDAESVRDWTPDSEDTGGGFRINGGSEFVSAIQTRQEIVIWTDKTMHSMRFVGAPFTFGQKLIASNITIMGPKAATVAADNNLYFMGLDNFYVYSGRVQPIPCTVRSYVFDDFNRAQRQKTNVGQNRADNEIWWFYPSASSDEINKYVVYNYVDQSWTIGTLARTAWIDRFFEDYPIAAGTDGYLYFHEKGCDDGSTSPASAINGYVESAELEPFSEGYKLAFCDQIIHDVDFSQSEASSPAGTATVYARQYPGGARISDDGTSTRSATSPVEQYTTKSDIRLRGRSLTFRWESNATGVKWRLGVPKLRIRADGRR